MQCKKKNWESLEANTNVAVKYDPDKPHYKLSVYKEPDGTSYGDSSVNRDPKWTENAPGAYNNFNGARTGKLGSTDTTPNPDWQSPTVRGTEVDRMKSKMPKEVLFTNASDAVSAADRTSLEAFGRALSMTRHPKLTIHLVGRTSNSGSGKSNLDLSRRRADNVLAAIRTGGTIVHDLKTEPKGEAGAGPEDKWRRVELSIDPVDPNWKNQYDVAGHEAGHMLGLADEYPRAGAPAPAHIKLVEEALGKEVAQTFLQREARSASIMSSGLDVRPYHYVTFWEALGRATTPTLTRTDWKIKT
jgi:outer membrane protein OmpA-like peptidoglycan-associated protein